MKALTRYLPSLLPCLLVIGVGAALRFVRCTFQSLWYDEVFSVVFSSAPGLEQLFATLRGDFHPPLYFVTLRAWLALFGPGDAPARLLSVCIGTSGLVFVWLLARECLRRTEHATALFIAATSLTLIWYAQEVRQYGLLFLTGAATLHSTILVTRGARFAPLYCAAATTALIYTHYAGILALGAAWVGLFVVLAYVWRTEHQSRSTLRAIASLAAAHTIAAVSFLPWLPTFLTQRRNAQHALWIPAPDIQTLLEIIPRLLAYRLPWDTSRYNWWLFAVCVPLSYWILRTLSRHHDTVRKPATDYSALCTRVLLVTWIIAPILGGYILSLYNTKILYFRNLLYIAPALALVLAQINAHSLWGRGVVAVVVAASLANLPWYYGSRHKEDWRRATPFITERLVANSSSIFDAPGTRLAYDYYAAGVALAEYDSNASQRPDRVFYIRALSATKIDTVIEKFQIDGYALSKRKNFPGIVVLVFDRAAHSTK